jgi:hypothetical protein
LIFGAEARKELRVGALRARLRSVVAPRHIGALRRTFHTPALLGRPSVREHKRNHFKRLAKAHLISQNTFEKKKLNLKKKEI